jgi:hypothetical protein
MRRKIFKISTHPKDNSPKLQLLKEERGVKVRTFAPPSVAILGSHTKNPKITIDPKLSN